MKLIAAHWQEFAGFAVLVYVGISLILRGFRGLISQKRRKKFLSNTDFIISSEGWIPESQKRGDARK